MALDNIMNEDDVVESQLTTQIAKPKAPYQDAASFMKSTSSASRPKFDPGSDAEMMHLTEVNKMKQSAGLNLASIEGDGRKDPNALFHAATNLDGNWSPEYDYARREMFQQTLAENPEAQQAMTLDQEKRDVEEKYSGTPAMKATRETLSDAGKAEFDARREEEVMNKVFASQYAAEDPEGYNAATDTYTPKYVRDYIPESQLQLERERAIENRTSNEIDRVMREEAGTGKERSRAEVTAEIQKKNFVPKATSITLSNGRQVEMIETAPGKFIQPKNSAADQSDTRQAGVYDHPAGWEVKGRDGKIMTYTREKWAMGDDKQLYPIVRDENEKYAPEFPAGVKPFDNTASDANSVNKVSGDQATKNIKSAQKILKAGNDLKPVDIEALNWAIANPNNQDSDYIIRNFNRVG